MQLLHDGKERRHAEKLVDEAARDAKHGRAAVLALGVELEGSDLVVVVAHPVIAADVPRGQARVVRVEEEVAGLAHAGHGHDLQPPRRGKGLRSELKN